MRMLTGSFGKRALTVLIPWILVTWAACAALPAETHLAAVIGKVESLHGVSINGSAEPSGRVILSGDIICARYSPVLVTLKTGGKIFLDQGSIASITRDDKALSVRADRGFIGFRFEPREEVRIETASYRFSALNRNSANIGELAVGGRGEISVTSGGFSAVEKASGREYEIASMAALPVPQAAAGKGTLTRGRNTLTDETQAWTAQSLAGKCIVVGGETHRVTGAVSPTRLTVEGEWSLPNGTYDYVLSDCVQAKKEPPKKPEPQPTQQVPKHGMSKGTKTAIGVLAGGGAAGVVGYLVSKSGS